MNGEALGKIHDVIIVGAGPAGLAIASRLREHTPSAIFTDDEHHRYHWLQKHSGKMSIRNIRGARTTKRAASPLESAEDLSILVLDGSGTNWMANWNRLFSIFEISHLRSPMFFHVDPKDRDALLAYAEEQGNNDDLIEIGGCVGKERSKHHKKKDRKLVGRHREPAVDERDRKDYFVPSTKLFDRHCCETACSYDLQSDIVRQEIVEDIDYGPVQQSHSADEGMLFTIKTNKATYRARSCVLAIGSGVAPRMPPPFNDSDVSGCCHAMQIKSFPAPTLRTKIKANRHTTALVIGGGLTAAHLAVNALKHGVSRVWMITRSQLKIKPFDVDLDWIGKFRNTNQAVFWSADTDEERLQQIRDARNGGSITPRIHKIMQPYIATGRLQIKTNTTIATKSWIEDEKAWSITTTPPIENMPSSDYIYCATGLENDVKAIECLQTLHSKYPVRVLGGLPCLTDDLAWSAECPLFVTGRLAGLRLGPGAANLSGARIGAERVAWSIQSILEKGSNEDLNDHNAARDYAAGIGSRYDCLGEE